MTLSGLPNAFAMPARAFSLPTASYCTQRAWGRSARSLPDLRRECRRRDGFGQDAEPDFGFRSVVAL